MNSKKITMFIIKSCPYCKEALNWMDELYSKNPEYKSLEIEIIDENEHPDIADRYDYHYVPTYYIANKKVHEGVANLKKIQHVLDIALGKIK